MNKKKIIFPEQQEMFRGEIGKLILSKDWSGSGVGEIQNWSETLTSIVRLCLDARFAASIWWGDELFHIYNDAFYRLFDIKGSELELGASARENPRLWNALGDSLNAVRKQGRPVSLSKKIKVGTGDKEFFFDHTPVFESSGPVGGVFTIVTEANEKVREKQTLSLELNEQRYLKMIEEVQDYAIILLDKEGTVLNWNKGAEKIKGYRDEEIIGQKFSVFYREEDRKNKLPEQLISLAEREGRAMHEGWRKRKDGSKFWGSIVITALHDRENNIIGFTKVTRDLTERKLAEDTMRQHAMELEEKNKQLEQFAYIASHDLQEPLRKIQTFIQVVERKLSDPEARQKYFTKINLSAKRMGELIQSVLNYSRLSQNEDHLQSVDLNVVLENVRADFELQIEERHATIESETLPIVKGIGLQLSQLFSNLIGNSLKFTKGEPKITLSCKLLQPGEIQKIKPSLDNSKVYAKLIFKDNGIGFEQQYAEKIFTIFQRLNSREEYSGTGIGLALCKRIVDHHAGHIEAFSEPGHGATFFVYLPLE